MSVNVELMRKVAEHITTHPEEWSQGTWGFQVSTCGTTFCFAGHTVAMSGADLEWHPNGVLHLADGVKVEDKARELLGLDFWSSEKLFYGNYNNHLSTMWRIVNQITDGEIEIPEEFK